MYYIIDTDKAIHGRPTLEAGPFKTVRAAEQHLRKECVELVECTDIRPECVSGVEWYKPFIIVKRVKAVQPVPRVTVTCKLVHTNQGKDT